MSIIDSDIQWRLPTEVSDNPSNGGRMSHMAIVSATKNNVFSSAQQGEREAGSTKKRKLFLHVANDDDLSLIAPKIFVETVTGADDRILFFPGNQTNTQSALTGSERLYGGGVLQADVSAEATTITVRVEDAVDNIFREGDKIRISNKTSVKDLVGVTETKVISGTPTYVGNVATIQLTTALVNPFLALNTKVAPIYEPGDIKASYSSFVDTSVLGSYNIGTYPVLVDHIGGVEATVTLTFLTSTTFSGTTDTGINLGSGNISSNFAPANPAFSKPFFMLRAAGFLGIRAPGDTIVFVIHPASCPLWFVRIIPPNCGSLTGNKFLIGVDGESE